MMLTLLAPIAMQGSEHWVFIEKESSELEELALKQIIETQREEPHAALTEKQSNVDVSNVAVGESNEAAKQERAREEIKTQMAKRVKMIASPEDFESLWEDEADERENKELSSETDSQTTEEREEQRNKTESVGVALTELKQPTDSPNGPEEKSNVPGGFCTGEEQRHATSWPEFPEKESKIAKKEQNTSVSTSDKDILKKSEAVRAKVKLGNKTVSSAAERIIYLGCEETNEADHKTKKMPAREQGCSTEEKQKIQMELVNEKGKNMRLAPAVDGEMGGYREFQSRSPTSGEGKLEIGRPTLEEDGTHVYCAEWYINERVEDSPTAQERAFAKRVDYETKDYRESSSYSFTEKSSPKASCVTVPQLDRGSLTNAQAQGADEMHSALQEEGNISTGKVGMAFRMDKSELEEMEASQIFLQMEAIEITKSILGSSSQQLSSAAKILEGEQCKPQHSWAGESVQEEVLHSYQAMQGKCSKVQEPPQDKSMESEGLAKAKQSESAKDETSGPDSGAKDKFQELQGAADPNRLEVDQLAKGKTSLSENSTIDISTLDHQSELKNMVQDGSSKAGEAREDELYALDRLELGKYSKVEGIAKHKTLESEGSAKDKLSQVEKLAKDNLPDQKPILESEVLAQNKSCKNLKQASEDMFSYQAGCVDSKPLELKRTSQNRTPLKTENEATNVITHHSRLLEEMFQPDYAVAQSRGPLQIASKKQKINMETLKHTACGIEATPSQKPKDVASSRENRGGSLDHRSEMTIEVSVASKIKMFEQGEMYNPLLDEQRAVQKGFFCESWHGSKTHTKPPTFQIELQKGIFLDKNCAQVKDPGDISDPFYLSVTQEASEEEPSQPSSWKEDISVESEQGGGDVELASPDSGCEITLAEVVVISR